MKPNNPYLVDNHVGLRSSAPTYGAPYFYDTHLEGEELDKGVCGTDLIP